MLTEATDKSLSILVAYPGATVSEIYTFFRDADGKAEVMWTSNKGGEAAIMKVSAYRADCSFLAF